MTSLELLDLIGAIDDKYIWEAHSNLSYYKRRTSIKRSILIAAMITILLLLVGCAVVFMKLQDLKIGEFIYTYPEYVSELSGQTITSDMISMQGFMDSENYRAAMEWNEFLKNYDTDGELLKNAKTDDYQESMEYMAYTCYTREMQDKIDEICEKYNLEILGPDYMEAYTTDVVKAVGIYSIFSDNANVSTKLYDGYYYRDGTFALSGETTLNYEDSPWIYPITYQYRCVMKTAFDSVFLSIGDMKSYEEWNYTLKDGTEVLLALSPEKAIIIVDKDKYFVTVNILETRVGDVMYGEQQMDRAVLEAFAETFTFDYVPQGPKF